MSGDLVAWVSASPKQRLAVLRATKIVKRPANLIRERAKKFNPRLSYSNVRAILNALEEKGLTRSCILQKKKHYWITKKGYQVLGGVGLDKAE